MQTKTRNVAPMRDLFGLERVARGAALEGRGQYLRPADDDGRLGRGPVRDVGRRTAARATTHAPPLGSLIACAWRRIARGLLHRPAQAAGRCQKPRTKSAKISGRLCRNGSPGAGGNSAVWAPCGVAARAARRAQVVTGVVIINLERHAPACGVRQCPRANCRQQTHTTRGATTRLLSWMARTHARPRGPAACLGPVLVGFGPVTGGPLRAIRIAARSARGAAPDRRRARSRSRGVYDEDRRR